MLLEFYKGKITTPQYSQHCQHNNDIIKKNSTYLTKYKDCN